MLLDEVVTEAYSAPHSAKDLRVDSPIQKVFRVELRLYGVLGSSHSRSHADNTCPYYGPSRAGRPGRTSRRGGVAISARLDADRRRIFRTMCSMVALTLRVASGT